MPDWIDTPGEIGAVVAIMATVLASLAWLIKAQIAMSHEMKPNSGSSMRDAVNRIEDHIVRIEEKIDHHVTWHLEEK